jgi:hypothetical protein
MQSVTETVAADHRTRLQARAEVKRLLGDGPRSRRRPRHLFHAFAPAKLAEPAPLIFCIGR